MLIEITYNVTDVFMSTTETPVYVEISFEQPGSASAVWGSITGTLSNQTDLQNALNAKLDESTIDGGTEGQILSKASATDFDFAWINNYAKYLATNVRNQTGSTINAFQVVYISGATGNKPLISLADADTEATSSKTYGVTATAIANNGTGDVVTAGELTGIDTSAFNEGDLLWLSTTAGGVVTSPPAEPAHAVFIGYVVRSHPTLGTIDVSIQNGYELNELHGVQITTPTDNQGLFYNSTSTLWENKSITTALGYTPVPTTRNITINGVTYDLSADRTWTIAAGISGSGASGQVTYWTGASAVSGSNNLFWDNTNGRLGIGTNSPLDFNLVVQGAMQVRSIASAFQGIRIDSTSIRVRHSSTFSLGTNDSAIAISMFAPTNNVGINTTSDLGVRFGVVGDTLLRGSGNTSATTALTVQNSGSVNLLRVLNDGQTILRGTTNNDTTNIFRIEQQNGNGRFLVNANGQTIIAGDAFTSSETFVSISRGNFNPTSGTATHTSLAITPTINQTGGANGITRGLYVNPTLTAAADFRAIETSAGNVLFGSNFFWDNTNGRLGIGTNAPSAALDVRGNIYSFGTIPFFALIPSGWGGQSLLIQSGVTQTGSTTGNYSIFKHDGSSRGWAFAQGSTVCMQIAPAGNVSIGTVADLGTRLGVVGDTLLRGSGASNITTALTVQNSSSQNIFIVRNDRRVGINTINPEVTFDVRGVDAGIFLFRDAPEEAFINIKTGTTASSTGVELRGLANQKGFRFCDSVTASNNYMQLWASGNLTIQTATFSSYTDIASALLQVNSTTKGFLPPRMTTTQKNAITSPANGLIVFDTTLNKLCVYTTAWETITSI